MLDYKELLDSKERRANAARRPMSKGSSHGYKRTDPEYYINQIPIAEAEHSSSSKYALPRDHRFKRLWKKVGVLVAALFLLSFVRLKEDAGVVKQYKPETYEQSKAKARRFLSLQSLLTPISGGGVLLNKTSPQYKALDWLANADAAKLEPPSANDDNHNLYQLAQRYILAVLYFATGGPTHWEKDYNWLSGKHVCEWSDGGGIRKCDSNQQVMDISLWNKLQGTIPEEITKLETLRVLYLSRNALTGPIPSSLGMMPHLNYLGLQHNKLTGTVPTELGQLKHLSYLGLEKNDFTGSVDKSHPVCKLRALDADGNPTKTTTLMVFTTDCRGIEGVKPPEIECVCCTECSRY